MINLIKAFWLILIFGNIIISELIWYDNMDLPFRWAFTSVGISGQNCYIPNCLSVRNSRELVRSTDVTGYYNLVFRYSIYVTNATNTGIVYI